MKIPQIIAVSRAQVLAEVEAKIADARKQSSTPTQPGGTTPSTGVDPSDIGHDIIPIIGQSNAKGTTGTGSIDANLDFPDPRIYQFCSSGPYQGQVIRGIDPLYHFGSELAGQIGFAMSFARWYVQTIPPNRTVLLVPAAEGGTGFLDGRWKKGGDCYNNAVARTNAAKALNLKNRVVAFLWLQGENDVSMTKADYIAQLDLFINNIKTDTGTQTARFLLGEMVPTWVAADSPVRLKIQQAIQETPSRLAYTAVATGQGLTGIDNNIHYNAVSQRILGFQRFPAAFLAAANNVPAPPSQPTGITFTPSITSVAVDWQQAGFASSWEYGFKLTTATDFTNTTTQTKPLTITGLVASTTYDFRVRSINSLGQSTYLTGQFTTSAAPTLPRPLFKMSPKSGTIQEVSGNSVAFENLGGIAVTSDATRGQVLSFGAARELRLSAAIPSSYTKAAWLFLTSATAPNPNIISSDAATVHTFWMVGTERRLTIGHGSTLELLKDDVLFPLNIWVHVAATYNNSTKVMRIFRDGVKVKESTLAPTSNYAGSANPTRIGAFNALDNSWIGFMDLPTAWGLALSESEIQSVYESER